MGMLERIKKKQFDGFREFVESMEVTPAQQRSQILLSGILDDPVFMKWVTHNIRGFRQFLDLPSDELSQVLGSNESLITILAKALEDRSTESLQRLAPNFPRYYTKLKEEVEVCPKVSTSERESAQFLLLKTVRKMQKQELIQGFRWELPPPEVFRDRPVYKDGMQRINFENGTLAAEGEFLKNKRIGLWKHFYDDGKLLALGTYVEDRKHGKWQFFYGNGSPRAEGNYRHDQRHGDWSEWDRDGVQRLSEWTEGKRSV